METEGNKKQDISISQNIRYTNLVTGKSVYINKNLVHDEKSKSENLSLWKEASLVRQSVLFLKVPANDF